MFDHTNPEYVTVFQEREERLLRLRKDPVMLAMTRAYYRTHIPDFINDWGMTYDPRLIEKGFPATIPFVLFPRQRDWLEFILQQWRTGKPGITEKSRDMGITWLAAALSCSLSIFNSGMAIGFGSRKEEYVDKLGSPKCIFYKIRMFMQYLPVEFSAGWTPKSAPHMRCEFPDTGSIISGEAGDNIGRGDRASIYFVDEAAHLERPQLVDASLSATTNCRQDLSSVNGMANSFAERRWGGKIDVFTFSWRDDPRKGDAWYEKQQAELDPIIVAQEIDMNYSASVEGIVIPAEWVNAAIDSHIKLGIKPTGAEEAALDVADRGVDKNAFAWRHGMLLKGVKPWSGKGSDIFATTQKAFQLMEDEGVPGALYYDADGLGASVRGDARVINEQRAKIKARIIRVQEFRGSAAVMFPEAIVRRTDRKNEDFFANYKAQAWWHLRFMFQETFKAVNGLPHDSTMLISIASGFPERAKLCIELSQPVYKLNTQGKIVIDKTPDEVASPNHADAVMILYAPRPRPMNISPELLARV